MTETYNLGRAATAAPADLNLFHNNPRTGNIALIKESLETNGAFKPIVVNKGTHTGRPMEVLAGNHTLQAIRELHDEHPDDERWATVAIWEVDVDEDRATKIVLADNKTADAGSYDDTALFELLSSVDDNLDGTGYGYDDLEDLSALMDELATPEPVPAPSGGGEVEPAPQSREEASNLYETKSQVTSAPGYADMPTRMMILHYPLDQFVWVNDQLGKLHDLHPEWEGANAAALVAFIEERTGDKCPEA